MLLASLVYLSVTNTEFHEGGVRYAVAVAQFVTVPIGLVLAGSAFAVQAAALAGRQTGRRLGDFVPDGTIVVVVGMILLGIGLGQIGNDRLMPPKWNWISFLGLTVTGALVLIVVRGAVKAALGRGGGGAPANRLLGILATDIVLVAGLGVMMYGALNNLVLGANGFRTGFAGNGDGLVLWVVAALFLVFVRGGFKLAVARRSGVIAAVARELLLVVGIFAFIVGERSVIAGKPPGVPIGGAFLPAAAILLGALFLLVPARLGAKEGLRDDPQAASGT